MPLKHWVPLAIALVLNAAANVLMKIAAVTATPAATDASLVTKARSFLNLLTVLAIGLFAANVLFYRKALEHIDVSVAYPIMVSLGMVLVVSASVLLGSLRERLTATQMVGMALVAAGVWLIASKH